MLVKAVEKGEGLEVGLEQEETEEVRERLVTVTVVLAATWVVEAMLSL